MLAEVWCSRGALREGKREIERESTRAIDRWRANGASRSTVGLLVLFLSKKVVIAVVTRTVKLSVEVQERSQGRVAR